MNGACVKHSPGCIQLTRGIEMENRTTKYYRNACGMKEFEMGRKSVEFYYKFAELHVKMLLQLIHHLVQPDIPAFLQQVYYIVWTWGMGNGEQGMGIGFNGKWGTGNWNRI